MEYKTDETSFIFKQLSWWKRLALSLPYGALSLIVILLALDINTIWDKVFVLAISMGVTLSAFWWWWVMHTVNYFSDSLLKTSHELKNFKQEIKNIKEDL